MDYSSDRTRKTLKRSDPTFKNGVVYSHVILVILPWCRLGFTLVTAVVMHEHINFSLFEKQNKYVFIHLPSLILSLPFCLALFLTNNTLGSIHSCNLVLYNLYVAMTIDTYLYWSSYMGGSVTKKQDIGEVEVKHTCYIRSYVYAMQLFASCLNIIELTLPSFHSIVFAR